MIAFSRSYQSMLVLLVLSLLANQCSMPSDDSEASEGRTPSEHLVATHPNGNKKTVYRYVGVDSLNREEITYHENGEVMTRGSMLDGQRHGEWKSFHPGGQTWSSHYYNKGVQEGLYRVYWHTGLPRIHGHYKDGLKSGEWVFFTEKGDTARVLQFDSLSTTPLPQP